MAYSLHGPAPGGHTTQKAAKPWKKSRRKKVGSIAKDEVALVGQILSVQNQELTPRQERAIATVLRRSPEKTKEIILKARDAFNAASGDYVDIHMRAIKGALEAGNYETAAKGAQWAMANGGEAGARVVDRQEDGGGQTKVLIGLALGGITAPVVTKTNG